MDDQLFKMLQERFDRQDRMLTNIETNLKEHTQIDEKYWRKLDIQEGQVSLLKWLFGGTVTTVIGSGVAWIITNIGG